MNGAHPSNDTDARTGFMVLEMQLATVRLVRGRGCPRCAVVTLGLEEAIALVG